MKSLLVFIMLISASAFSGTVLEPYFGMHMNSTIDLDGVDKTGELSGTAIGARIGFQNMGFMLGLNAKTGVYEIAHDLTGIDGTELDYSQYGFFVGYDFPILLRVWGEYILAGTAEVSDDGGEYGKVSGTRLGIGYKVMPFVSVNLEVGNETFSEYKTSAGVEGDAEQVASTYLFSISIPLSL